MTTIVIVDDHAVVREGTRELLTQDPTLDVVGEAGSAEEALGVIESLQPDVVLLDLALPDASGIEVARRIPEMTVDTKVVILSAYDDDDYVLAALELGVAAYLLKTVRAQDVIDAIHAIERGQVVLHPSVARKLRRSLTRQLAEGAPVRLTDRELEVLKLAAAGLQNHDIALRLSISVRTVEGHFSHIFSKLNVANRLEAVVHGLAQSWFTLESAHHHTGEGIGEME